MSEAAMRERVAQAVRDTVHAHMVADVPVGVFLSGGIDSGAILSTARSLTGADLHTYTVVVDEDEYSEASLAREVAEAFGSTHHVLRVDGSSIHRELRTIVERIDQPTARETAGRRPSPDDPAGETRPTEANGDGLPGIDFKVDPKTTQDFDANRQRGLTARFNAWEGVALSALGLGITRILGRCPRVA